jgi:hypothetical protein
MATTKEKQAEQKKDHEEFLAGMSKEERILHVAAGAAALHEKFADAMEHILEQAPPGLTMNQIGHAQIAMPLGLIAGVSEVMGEMLVILEEHKIITKGAVDEFVARKKAEIKTKAGDEDKPEGWCPGCQMVHGDDDEEEREQHPLVAAIVSLMMAGRAAQERAENGEPEASVPPNTTVH